MKVIIVGGGIMGLCAAWALHRAGHRPVLYEQGPIPNPLGSSVDRHRVIRYPYGAMTGYARMVRGAFGAWRRLFADLGCDHFQETGVLAVTRNETGWTAQSFACLRDMGIDVARLGPDEIARILPLLDVAPGSWALYTPSGGVLFAEAILRDLAVRLRTEGVPLHDHRPVRKLDPAQAKVTLESGDDDRGDGLIVAAGPWSPRLLPMLRGRVTPSRQIVVYLDPPAEHRPVWAKAPILLDQIETAKGGFYLVPPIAGTALKVGDHGFSLQGQPDRDRQPTPDDAEAAMAVARARIAAFDRYRIGEIKTCFYSVAAGERFIVEPVEKAWVLAGFSGHGFKFAALIGEAIAAVLRGERSPASLQAWAAGEDRSSAP